MAMMMKLACVVLVCMVVVLAPHAEAITCGQVASGISGCIPYLTKKQPAPSPACCVGIKKLVSMTPTPADRRTACTCLKSAAASIKGIDYALAAAVPAKCGARISYPISLSTDCSKVN